MDPSHSFIRTALWGTGILPPDLREGDTRIAPTLIPGVLWGCGKGVSYPFVETFPFYKHRLGGNVGGDGLLSREWIELTFDRLWYYTMIGL